MVGVRGRRCGNADVVKRIEHQDIGQGVGGAETETKLFIFSLLMSHSETCNYQQPECIERSV